MCNCLSHEKDDPKILFFFMNIVLQSKCKTCQQLRMLILLIGTYLQYEIMWLNSNIRIRSTFLLLKKL